MTTRKIIKSGMPNRQPANLGNDSQTKQSFKDDCDINRIMADWMRTGEVQHQNRGTPTYGDYSNVTDYLTASQAVLQAKASFMELPALVRERMGNDPGKLLSFLDDPENEKEAISLGLLPEAEKAPEKPDLPSQKPEPIPPTQAVIPGSEPPPKGGIQGGE